MSRQGSQRQAELEPERIAFAKQEIQKLGYEIIHEDHRSLRFIFQEEEIVIHPYSGWHSGKSIKDGRGITHLIAQIKPQYISTEANRAGDDICSATGKIIHLKRGAQEIINRAKSGVQRNHKPRRKYHCSHCNGWHLTSKS